MGERDDMGIGDGYLQEMRMVCMDEYEMARDEVLPVRKN